jgi:hypothetical protein
MAVTAADVPSKYDLVINDGTNTRGYTFLRTLDGSYLSANRHRAEYTSTPTFVERQNISNAYGDNAQDFFLTARNRDWSLGEQQKYFRASQDGRYWMGQNIDVSTPGQVSLQPSFATSSTLAETVIAGSRGRGTVSAPPKAMTAGATKLYEIDAAGAATDLGAHGLGAIPSRHGVCSDGWSVFLSTYTAGTVGVRKWNGSVFSTFSATPADSLAFVNNTLYGLQGFTSGTTALVQYDTGGTATTLFTWKGADGSTPTDVPGMSKIEPYGGKLLVLLGFGQDAGGELWIYDGAGTSRLEVFPPNFYAYDVEVLYGIVYVSGSFLKAVDASNVKLKPAVHFFDGSQIGKLWEATAYGATSYSNIEAGPHPALTIFAGQLVFGDDTTGNVMAYSPERGGVSSIATYTVSGPGTPRLFTSGVSFIQTRSATTYQYFPGATYASSGYFISSLIDFESSLAKQFRGVKVEFAAGSDGNGGSVDIAYQVDSLDGSWTTLRTGAVSGTEYTFTNISGHAVAVKVTLNRGTSTTGPTVKNLNVRAAPVLQSFNVRTYNLDLSSLPSVATILEDGSPHPLTGFDQAVNLRTAIRSTTPLTITDKFGTFTGICEPSNCSILELHSDESAGLAHPGQFIGQITVREV